jgi:3-hydroxybutyryl-CoA dehydrogenase
VSQRRETTAPNGPRADPEPPSERLGIAGAGTIACELAVCAAGRGGEALIWARSERSAERAREQVEHRCAKLEDGAAAARVTVVSELAELSDVTLGVEAVVERERPKREVLGALGRALAEDALIATTTSSLKVADLAQASGRPDRFFALHPFNPVTRMELVELCFAAETTVDSRVRAARFCETIGKTAIEVPDETGFVVNRLLFPYLFDAVRLLERTGMSAGDMDACMKLGASHPMGPLELLDLIGLDVADAIGEALYGETGDAAHRPPGRIKDLVRQGKLGRKRGAGFHTYG